MKITSGFGKQIYNNKDTHGGGGRLGSSTPPTFLTSKKEECRVSFPSSESEHLPGERKGGKGEGTDKVNDSRNIVHGHTSDARDEK